MFISFLTVQKSEHLGAVLLDPIIVDEAEVHEIPVVLVVVEGVPHHELVRYLEAHVVGDVAVAERRPFPQEACDQDSLRLVLPGINYLHVEQYTERPMIDDEIRNFKDDHIFTRQRNAI